MERIKMPRQDRAKQFAPFDALKGLQDALRLKEYQHERINKSQVQEEKADEISKVLINLEKGDRACVTYFENGHNKNLSGEVKLLIDQRILKVGSNKINLDDVLDIKKIN